MLFRSREFSVHEQRAMVRRLCTTFRERIAQFSTMDTLDVWYYQFSADSMLTNADSRETRGKEQAVINKAKGQSSRLVTSHDTELVNGRLRIKDEPPLMYHLPVENRSEAKQLDTMVRHFIAKFRETLLGDRRVLFDRYELVDIAIRVVGVGSVGTRCYVALFMSDGQFPLFLQIKEARASVLEGYLPRSQFANHGERVVTGQRLLQSASDIFLGWSMVKETGIHFYVRQLRDMKGSFDFTNFAARDLSEYAVSCAHALAQAMSKAGDPAVIRGYLGKSDAFDGAIEQFALAYAEQNEADWSALKTAVKAGKIQAVRE